MVLREAGCVRAIELREKSTIIFNVTNDDDKLEETIKTCAQNHNMGQYQSRTKMEEGSEIIELYHITWQTHVFGFIDDMFLGIEVDPADPNNRIVNI